MPCPFLSVCQPLPLKFVLRVLKTSETRVKVSMTVLMLETLKSSKTLKPSRDDFNVYHQNGKHDRQRLSTND